MDHADRADPVNFSGTSAGATDVEYGPVRAAVSYVTVQLSDGTVLRLHPVSVYGLRYVAFAVPLLEPVSRITAYSARGEVAAAIPFNDPAGGPTVVQWLGPGQRGLPRASGLIGSGGTGARAWSVTAYVGPWGECLDSHGNGGGASACDVASAPLGAKVLASISGTSQLMVGAAAADVDHVVITLAGGGNIRVPAVRVGELKFFVLRAEPGAARGPLAGLRRRPARGRLRPGQGVAGSPGRRRRGRDPRPVGPPRRRGGAILAPAGSPRLGHRYAGDVPLPGVGAS